MRRCRENKSKEDFYVQLLVDGGYSRERAEDIIINNEWYNEIEASSIEEFAKELCFKYDDIDERSFCFNYVDFQAIGDDYIDDGRAFKVDDNTYIEVLY